MMRRFCLLILLLALTVTPSHAQQTPLVVFIDDNQLRSAAVSNRGAAGLTLLGDLFRSLGARTQFARLSEPLPEDAKVIVLIGPRTTLPPADVARLWTRISAGSNLLLALDPQGHNSSNPEAANSGLATLLTTDFGLILQNGFLIEPWFNSASIRSVPTSDLQVHGGPLANPISDPLATYDIPVEVWGARHVRVEPIGPDSLAAPLLWVEPEYAETDPQIFNNLNPDPLQLNLGVDYVGRLTVGAVGENTRLNSRVALLADSEMLENGFGLAHLPNSVAPRHLGNFILAQRLAAWLLELPEDQWPPLPSGYTWLAIDGDPSDWDANLPTVSDAVGDTSVMSFDITEARTFRNDSFVYVLVETAAAPNQDAQLTFQIDQNGDGTPEITVVAHSDGTVALNDGTPVFDAQMAVGAALEVRLPLRLLGQGSISSLCLDSARELAFPLTPDCLDSPLTITTVQQRDPASDRFFPGILATVFTTDRANIRSGPGTDSLSLGSFRNGEVLAAIGRNEAGDWIEVENAQVSGWIASILLIANGDFQSLPIVTTP